MNLRALEKNLIEEISLSDNLNIQSLLSKYFEGDSILEKRNFLLIFDGKNGQYYMGLTSHEEEDLANVVASCEVFAIQINEFVQLINFLNQRDFISVVSVALNVTNEPMITIGKPGLIEGYKFVKIENNGLAKELARYNSSIIAARPKLSELIENKFVFEEDLKYNRTLEIASRTSKNSNKLVLLNVLAFFLALRFGIRSKQISNHKLMLLQLLEI